VSTPLLVSFEVACPVDHAFTVWTSGIGTWWPRDHTVTGDPGLRVVMESGVGGRIFERTADGAEHDWGEVTAWNPPERLAYRWHLRQDPAEATDVEIRFRAEGGSTRIEIVHRGWERLGDSADEKRDRNRVGWSSLVPHYVAAVVT